MGIYETELGYKVTEFNGGLDVTEDGEFVCELTGKTLNDYRTDKDDEDSDIDEEKLNADIYKEQVDVEDFMANMQGNYWLKYVKS